ncbi:10899_t:CDS:2 [Entrophospora sp. SA101]|nr:10899_t:CDS:2 [Entrophospora sp. SA101]
MFEDLFGKQRIGLTCNIQPSPSIYRIFHSKNKSCLFKTKLIQAVSSSPSQPTFSAERSSLSALALYPCSSPGSIKARFFFASSSLSHDARGGLLFDDPHDNKFDDDNVAFDGAENVNDDVDNVDIFADY